MEVDLVTASELLYTAGCRSVSQFLGRQLSRSGCLWHTNSYEIQTRNGCAMFQIFGLYFGDEYEQIWRNLETVKQQIMNLDPNVKRSMLFRRTLANGIICYHKLYESKNKATSVETVLDKYFSRKLHSYLFFTRFSSCF
jgi:hypothetical protein